MAVFKCKMCGGTIEFEPGATVGVCDYCGTKQTLPRLNDEKRANLYDRANHFRRNNEFDKATSIYEQILNEDTTDAEAYWSLVLCQYGIEYVEDPTTHKRVPTVNRTQFTSIFDDDNYKSAIKYADSTQREIYENEAKTINEIQKGILSISQKEEPFDVFICYKETDNNGRRTPDSVLANDLYHQLVQEGFKVFFARITLEDKLGTAYEPYIFAALNSAKVMVVLGTKPEYFNAVWVKNEWSRYLSLVKKSGGKKILIPAYKDMDPYDLPDEFSHLQAQDMSKLGFMQDLIRGIKKISQIDTTNQKQKTTVDITSNNNVEPLLERVFLFLEDSNWEDADLYCEKVLDIDPKNVKAYLGKLMADLQVKSIKELADLKEPFDKNENYKKVLRFADEKLESEMRGYIAHIIERNENERISNIYNNAIENMNKATSDSLYMIVAEQFKSISGYKDADELAEQCLGKALISRKDSIYDTAVARMNTSITNGDFESAAQKFQSISGYKDADELAKQCIDKAKGYIYDQAKTWIGTNTIFGYENAIAVLKRITHWRDADDQVIICERKIEELMIKKEKMLKFIKKVLIIVSFIVIISMAINFIYNSVILPKQIYEKEINNLSSATIGSYVFFGAYEQDNNIENGMENIEWLVLEKKENRVLLISKYILDYMLYDSSKKNITWEKSSLRSWLNVEFINIAFTSEEKKNIVAQNVTADKNPIYDTTSGNDTIDKVFLLSIKEASQYFASNNERKCIDTKSANANAIERRDYGYNNWWWLRSPGFTEIVASEVYSDGVIDNDGSNVYARYRGVRPAMWVSYK